MKEKLEFGDQKKGNAARTKFMSRTTYVLNTVKKWAQ